MSKQNLLKVFVASVIALPALISTPEIAGAQNFVSRQMIVNGLQLQNPNQQVVQKRSKRRNGQRNVRRTADQQHQNGQFQNQPRVAKRRAPARSNQVAIRRAPQPANNPRMRRAPGSQNSGDFSQRAQRPVARSRAPGANNNAQRFRAPEPQNIGTSHSRAPTRVVKRRAPPSNTRRSRAPSHAAQTVNNNDFNGVSRNRAPQHFNTRVASADNQFNSRAISIEERAPSSSNGGTYGGSVDLEILFEYNSADISPKSLRQLLILGEALLDPALQGSRIMIAGHTDASGSNAYNINLSYRRAQSVSNFLANYAGISDNRLAIEGYGEELLKYPDAPESGQNRRVEIINLGS